MVSSLFPCRLHIYRLGGIRKDAKRIKSIGQKIGLCLDLGITIGQLLYLETIRLFNIYTNHIFIIYLQYNCVVHKNNTAQEPLKIYR